MNGFLAALADENPGLFSAAAPLGLEGGFWKALRAQGAHIFSKIAPRLGDTDSNVRQAAVEALAALGAKEQAPAIAARLGDAEWEVRQAAVEALAALGAKEQAPTIVARLGDDDSDVRQAAVGALGAKEQAPAIAARLGDAE